MLQSKISISFELTVTIVIDVGCDDVYKGCEDSLLMQLVSSLDIQRNDRGAREVTYRHYWRRFGA